MTIDFTTNIRHIESITQTAQPGVSLDIFLLMILKSVIGHYSFRILF